MRVRVYLKDEDTLPLSLYENLRIDDCADVKVFDGFIHVVIAPTKSLFFKLEDVLAMDIEGGNFYETDS